jgi:hypothetical protein
LRASSRAARKKKVTINLICNNVKLLCNFLAYTQFTYMAAVGGSRVGDSWPNI